MKARGVHKAWRPWLALCAAALLAVGCGGGGGGGGGGSTEPPPGGGGGTPLSGVLWHNNFALDLLDGTQLASLTGQPPRLVDADPAAQPAPDGLRYGIYAYDSRNGETRISIKRSSDGAVLFSRLYQGYLTAVQPSPSTASRVLVRYQDSPGSSRLYGAIDLASGDVLEVYPADTAAVAWLGDGRAVVLAGGGDISVGAPGTGRSATGRVNLLGRSVMDLAAQPGGTRLLLGLRAFSGSGDVEGTDLWLTNLDGSNTVRYTRTNISSYGVWSPDGARIGFPIDTGTLCVGGSCSGSCEFWHAPANATELNPLPAAPGPAGRFSVNNRQGQARTLGCGVRAWTP
jgi:hypothetical protein